MIRKKLKEAFAIFSTKSKEDTNVEK